MRCSYLPACWSLWQLSWRACCTAISSTGKAVLQSPTDFHPETAGGSLSRTFLRKALRTVEIAVTVTLLIAAGLLLKSFVRMRTTDIGCVTENVLTIVLQPTQAEI